MSRTLTISPETLSNVVSVNDWKIFSLLLIKLTAVLFVIIYRYCDF